MLVAAWPLLLARVPGARLCLLGDGPEEARLREQASALGVEASVAFLGGVPDVAPRLRAADAAVLPSRTEGMPVALIEAMSCGLPVVATAVGGSAEVLRDGTTGRLVPPDSPAALAEALAEALLEPAASARGRAARADVLARFAMDLVADRFLALYRKLACRGAAALGGGDRAR